MYIYSATVLVSAKGDLWSRVGYDVMTYHNFHSQSADILRSDRAGYPPVVELAMKNHAVEAIEVSATMVCMWWSPLRDDYECTLSILCLLLTVKRHQYTDIKKIMHANRSKRAFREFYLSI